MVSGNETKPEHEEKQKAKHSLGNFVFSAVSLDDDDGGGGGVGGSLLSNFPPFQPS